MMHVPVQYQNPDNSTQLNKYTARYAMAADVGPFSSQKDRATLLVIEYFV